MYISFYVIALLSTMCGVLRHCPLFFCAYCRNLEDFVFSHFPLINLRIRALRMVVEESRCSRKDKTHFWEDVSNATDKLASELRTLYSAPRIQVSST